jgi:ADP-heptose:LPS heptosyltransferase
LPGLRRWLPEARIDVLTLRPTTTELFAGPNPFVDRTFFLPFWTKGRVAFALALARFLLTKYYSVSFLAYPAARWEYQLMHALVCSRRRFSHSYGRAFWLDRIPGLSVRRVEAGQKRNVDRNLDLFRAAGYDIALAPGYELPQAWSRPSVRGNYLVIHVGSIAHDTFAAKRWPLENFIELGRRLITRGERVVYLSGPDERRETREAFEATDGSELFDGSLLETAHLLGGAKLVVTNDSGIGHLTAGLRRPVLSLFGPTALDSAPYGASATPLRPSTCPPCFDVRSGDMTCKLDIDYACLRRDLSVDLVEREALRILRDAA